MILAVASGKGGTGKTTVAASLSYVWPSAVGRTVTAVDLDVEAPNLHLFLKPDIEAVETSRILIPEADESKCNHCRACAEICQFKAITVMGDYLLTFPDTCHGCGGCLEVCPTGALTPSSREIGQMSWGRGETGRLVMGQLRIGEAMSPPLMREVKERLPELVGPDDDVIIDAPPGVSCPAINAVMDADAILLVTEPTPFGLFDLRLAVEAFEPLDKPLAVVVNRAGLGDSRIEEFCQSRNLPVAARIPFRQELAEAYSKGEILAKADGEIAEIMTDLARTAAEMAASAGKERANG